MLSKSDIKYLYKAKQVAMASDYPHIHVGCIAVYQGNIVAVGCNTNKTHPVQQFYNRYKNNGQLLDGRLIPKMHAEINCLNSIRHLDINFSKVKLYIFRIRYSQPYGITRPCQSCMAAIKDLGIRDIYYTTDEGFSYERIEKLQKGGVA